MKIIREKKNTQKVVKEGLEPVAAFYYPEPKGWHDEQTLTCGQAIKFLKTYKPATPFVVIDAEGRIADLDFEADLLYEADLEVRKSYKDPLCLPISEFERRNPNNVDAAFNVIDVIKALEMFSPKTPVYLYPTMSPGKVESIFSFDYISAF